MIWEIMHLAQTVSNCEKGTSLWLGANEIVKIFKEISFEKRRE